MIYEQVQDYYGAVLQSSSDLKTNACCDPQAMPAYQREMLSRVHPEVLSKFYGCGSPIPQAVEGKVIVDLGCGTGRDSVLLASLAGKNGRIIGVDMTKEQLEVANRHLPYHREVFGLTEDNLEFRAGYIEDLKAIGIKDNSVDIVVSNCVINLSPDKEKVFSEILRILKPGGELYFSDIFSSRRLPDHIAKDPVLVGECLGGALYKEDFRRLLAKLGVLDVRTVKTTPVTVNNHDLQVKLAGATFTSMTIRAFKLPLEDRCEDFGQVAYYQGGIVHSEQEFMLDDHHVFEKGRPMLVCGNTAMMLEDTRFAPYFKVIGNREQHFGLFDCTTPSASKDAPSSGEGCC